MTAPKFLTPDLLADRWYSTERSLAQRRHLHKGPPFHRVGGKVLYALADIEAFEDAGRTEPSEVA